MLALAAIESIVAVDTDQSWLSHMTLRGYLQHLVDSLLADNDQLQELLGPNARPLRTLYIFQSKIVSRAILSAIFLLTGCFELLL